LAAALPLPAVPKPETWRGLFAGIGGGGIVTAGAILAMAAHLEGRHVKTLDFTGLAQKNGAVVAHVQIAIDPDALDVVRIPLGTANLMLAADLAVGCSAGVLERNARDAVVIGNLDLAATAEFKRDSLLSIDALLHRRTIEKVTDAKASVWLHGVLLAERLFGNSQAMNTLLLGLAWQRGLVPVGDAAILRAIELNGAAVALNKRAFVWGRILAERPVLAVEILGQVDPVPLELPDLIEARSTALVDYQSKTYAARYRSIIDDVMSREVAVSGRAGALTRAAAEGLFHLMAYKDEYEVARLHASASYAPGVAFHMSPPLITRIDQRTGRRNKIAIPGWLGLPLFGLLRHGKILRGTALDLFGYQHERKAERALIEQYIKDLHGVLAMLRPEMMATAINLASLPETIRGFGPVKDSARAKAAARRTELLTALNKPPVVAMAAE
jgi:indolepyruvate ferredoxin oxidoreductase